MEEEEEGSPAQPEPSPPRTKWRRWRRASCEAGPRSPSAPTPRRPGRSGGARSPRRPRRGGERSGPAHYAKRPAPPPRGKGKRVGFSRRRGASMSARQARPLRRRPEPAAALFSPLSIFTSGFGAKAASKQVPCLRRVGPRRGGQGAGGRPASRRRRLAGAPGPLRLAGQLARDGTPGWELHGGGGRGGAAGVAGKEGFVIVFVSERSEFVTPVPPPPPPPARWEEEGECSSSSSSAGLAAAAGGGRARDWLGRARAPERAGRAAPAGPSAAAARAAAAGAAGVPALARPCRRAGPAVLRRRGRRGERSAGRHEPGAPASPPFGLARGARAPARPRRAQPKPLLLWTAEATAAERPQGGTGRFVRWALTCSCPRSGGSEDAPASASIRDGLTCFAWF
ncbi:collagen alpha-1(I) chain-like [Moschus berezovskii]|uniref:collagen alpha-1(I) chain-like n=1 Tax=Moschus berezovskii TaxID=68408 RepID=UPI00244440E1|nr:collagen alpha-1(I) chain-like [Moschus berezovskii]